MTTTPKSIRLTNIVATPGVLADFPRHIILDAMGRHFAGDWSEMSEEDQEANRAATRDGSRIFGSYIYNNRPLWVITDAEDDDGHRDVTTFLLPSEY